MGGNGKIKLSTRPLLPHKDVIDIMEAGKGVLATSDYVGSGLLYMHLKNLGSITL